MFQTGVANRGPKGFQFLSLPFGDQFHAPVRQIPNRARDLETRRHGFHGVAKSNALHATRIKNMHPASLHTAPRPTYHYWRISERLCLPHQPPGEKLA
jgi:hypothetical protein